VAARRKDSQRLLREEATAVWQGLKCRYRICLVNLAEAQGVRLTSEVALHFYKVLAVAPAVEKGEPQGIGIGVGVEAP